MADNSILRPLTGCNAFDQRIADFSDLTRVTSERPRKKVVIEYLRDAEFGSTEVTIGFRENEAGEERGFLGVEIARDFGDLRYERKHGPLSAIGESVSETWAMAFSMNSRT